MANKILTEEGYENRIRGVLGIDAAYLPDSVINEPDFVTIGELNIIELVPDYESKTDDDRIRLVSATIREVARLICPTLIVRLPKGQQGPHSKTDLQNIDWHDIANKLLEERNILISKITASSDDFFGFQVTDTYSLEQ